MNINGYSMAIFTYDNEQDYCFNALAGVRGFGHTQHAMHNLEALRGNE